MSTFSFSEFKPTIIFLIKFIGLYLVLNFTYGMIITNYYPSPDPMTEVVTAHSCSVLASNGFDVVAQNSESRPTTLLIYQGKNILSVYEGCNGINTMIIFLSFLLAFGPMRSSLLWFIPLGIFTIHIVNIARITLLFYVAQYEPDFLYFTHKYFFTAILYVVIISFWFWWVTKLARPDSKTVETP